jgi:tetratricopeptide (TPR) repeat protein
LLIIGVVAAAALAALWYLTARDARIRFLPGTGQPRWIVYPVPFDPHVRAIMPRSAVFRRTMDIAVPSGPVMVRLRAFQDCGIEVNGARFDLAQGSLDWKFERVFDVGHLVRQGANQVVVRVTNPNGPPALWIALSGPGWSVHSDESWEVSLEGAAWQAAREASAPMEIGRGSPLDGGERTLDAWRANWPLVLLFALASALFLAVARRLLGSGPSSDARSTWLAFGAVAMVWVALFTNNLKSLAFPIGFDVDAHLDYIGYIQEHKALPLADQGWEMHNPPLYYLIAALLLDAGGLSATELAAVPVLRGLALVTALAHVALVVVSLRLLFPGQRGKHLVGLVLAAFLPAQLYLAHYVTNELMAGTLSTAAVCLCLCVLVDENPSALRHAALGLCLGAALLTKVTALVLAMVVLTVLAGRLIARRQWRPMPWLRTVGVVLGVGVLVSGWHYARVWSHFGTPLVGSYDPASGFSWWQDPGYATTPSLLRFGRTLAQPYYSGLNGVPDGLYSSWWGDGWWGGAASRLKRPPWNYDSMAVGYLLALAPTALVLAGALAALVLLIRRPSAPWCLLLGLAAALASAVLYHFLRLPYFAHVKAFYALGAAVPFCACAALGFDVLARRSRAAALALGVAVGTWALCALASFSVLDHEPATLEWKGFHWLARRDSRQARDCFEQAVRRDPHRVHAAIALADLLAQAGMSGRARDLFEQLVRDNPDDPTVLFELAARERARGRLKEAIAHLRRLTEIAPAYPDAFYVLGLLSRADGDQPSAIAAYRQGLAVTPDSVPLHRALALELRQGDADRQTKSPRTLPGAVRPSQ